MSDEAVYRTAPATPGLLITYEELTKSTRIDIKKKLKHLATNASFVGLKQQLMKHNKVKHIKYKSLQLQPYLISANIHQYEAQIITACRSKCVKTVRSNFSKMYKNLLFCPLKCSDKYPNIDTHKHLLRYPNIKKMFLVNNSLFRQCQSQPLGKARHTLGRKK